MEEATISQPTKRASKEFRRRQLIEATISSIAKRGLGDTTLNHVSNSANLSQGIVNLHFKNKETLLHETLKYLRDEYEENWRKSLAKAGDKTAQKLASLLKSDYNSKVADPNKLAVWFAFWGEVKSRPAYKKICQDRVFGYTEILEELLENLVQEGNYKNINISNMAQSIISMADGLWLNMLISPNELKRQGAQKIMMQYLAQIFPNHKNCF